MANFGSVTNLKNDSIDEKVTTNGNGENTGVRVNSTLQDIVDTLTGSPVVSTGVPDPLSVFASAAQGLLADSAVQPTDLEAVAFSGDYNDLSTLIAVDGVTIIGSGTLSNPLSATFGFGFQGAYDPTGTSLYPVDADTIGAVPITAGMYWVVSANGTINGNAVSSGDGVFALVNNAADNDDSNWTVFPSLYGGLPVVSVTGLDTDNTDPQNPIIQIATGAGISGDGTPGSPLTVTGSSVLTGNVAYVDIVNGDDLTGAVGNAGLPYATPLAAQSDATAGTTIVVMPGAYTSVDPLGKDGVNWYFMPGASFAFTGVGWTLPVTGPTQTFGVFGYGEFNAPAAQILSLSTPSNVTINCRTLAGLVSTVTNGDTVIDCDTITMQQGMGFSAGTHVITARTITPGSSVAGMTISGTARVTVNGTLTSTSSVETLNVNGAGAFFTLNGSVEAGSGSTMTYVFDMGGGNVVINGNVYHRGAGHAIRQASGSLSVNNGYIRTTTGSTNAIQRTTVFGNTWLANVSLQSTTDSIVATSAAFIRCAGVYSTTGLGPGVGVTISGSYHIYDNSITVGQVATANADGTWSWA
jgi:hypothetical protein